MEVSYHARDCLTLCRSLQIQYKRWGKELAIGEMMRMAALEEPSKAMVIALCRLLFRSSTGEPLRAPSLGEPSFLGDASEECLPLQPVHVYEGIPFFVVTFWGLTGLPEAATWYLAHCLLDGVWNDNPFNEVDQKQLEVAAHRFIDKGPWKRPLAEGEQTFLLDQVKAKEPQPLPTVSIVTS